MLIRGRFEPSPEGRTMIWIESVKDIADATPEELEKLGIKKQELEGELHKRRKTIRKADPQERTRAAVYASGNKWAIENFEATHN